MQMDHLVIILAPDYDTHRITNVQDFTHNIRFLLFLFLFIFLLLISKSAAIALSSDDEDDSIGLVVIV